MRLRKFPALLLALLLLAAAVVAGCGGGGDDTTAPTAEETVEEPTALSKAELISRGDGICGEVNAAVGAIGASEEGETDEQIPEVADLYIGMVESIKALGTPTETDGYEEFIGAAGDLAAVEGEIKLAAERGDVEALGEAATEATPILEEFQAQAAIYGFEECSEPPSAPTITPGTGGAEGGEVEEGGVEVTPEVEEEIVPEEVAPEEEVTPEGGGVGGEEEVAPEVEEGGSSGGGIGPG